jgi:hypothetical protein
MKRGHHRANYGNSAISRHGNTRAGDRLLSLSAIPLKREPEAPSIRRTRFSIRSPLVEADLYTFNTLEEAARFAKGKIEALTAIKRSINSNRADATEFLKITPIAVPDLGRRRKRA